MAQSSATPAPYNKPPLTYDEQLDLLIQRGLMIADRKAALRWLKRVSYYRLSAYFVPFRVTRSDDFRPGTALHEVLSAYKFDGRLRLLVMQALERAEVAVRTSLTYFMGHQFGTFGYTDCKNFHPAFDHAQFINELNQEESRSNEEFPRAYRRKYGHSQGLPVWMATEITTLGRLSILYKHLRPQYRTAIAENFGVHEEVFGTWLHSLTYVRNLCAHHCRLWNRTLAIRPTIPRRWPSASVGEGKVYSILLILNYLMTTVAPKSRWKKRAVNLLLESDVNLGLMGFPANWLELEPWKSDWI